MDESIPVVLVFEAGSIASSYFSDSLVGSVKLPFVILLYPSPSHHCWCTEPGRGLVHVCVVGVAFPVPSTGTGMC